MKLKPYIIIDECWLKMTKYIQKKSEGVKYTINKIRRFKVT